ncbi:MAG: antibiotic biosynthesis monooxygenase [Pseudoflavonifractor sp.]|nr:antibiotic biosynthesis monooxygenase [Alloprevotella sp.]MCM1116740.1 antibiotic biosynthesis monooxygenase [Pseudoflavonifractor sp.]
MIRLNCSMLIEESSRRQPLVEAATELVELSLHDEGCIAYDLYGSLTADDRLIIVETWKDEKSLKKHMESPHFKRLVPKMQELSTMTLEQFNF